MRPSSATITGTDILHVARSKFFRTSRGTVSPSTEFPPIQVEQITRSRCRLNQGHSLLFGVDTASRHLSSSDFGQLQILSIPSCVLLNTSGHTCIKRLTLAHTYVRIVYRPRFAQPTPNSRHVFLAKWVKRRGIPMPCEMSTHSVPLLRVNSGPKFGTNS